MFVDTPNRSWGERPIPQQSVCFTPSRKEIIALCVGVAGSLFFGAFWIGSSLTGHLGTAGSMWLLMVGCAAVAVVSGTSVAVDYFNYRLNTRIKRARR